MIELISAILVFFFISFIQGLNFYILSDRKISLKESYCLMCVAITLNKLLFTGAGYAFSSFSQTRKMPLTRTLSTFFILELISIAPWLLAGFYFGAEIMIKIPQWFLVIFPLLVVTVWGKRAKVISLIKNIWLEIKIINKRIVFLIPFAILNIFLFLLYYFFLFQLFDFSPGFLNIIKISSISVATGYLSPVPAGLGFKEAALTLLLKESGLDWGRAISCALTDRILVTAFWSVLGFVVGYDLLKDEIKKIMNRWITMRKKC